MTQGSAQDNQSLIERAKNFTEALMKPTGANEVAEGLKRLPLEERLAVMKHLAAADDRALVVARIDDIFAEFPSGVARETLKEFSAEALARIIDHQVSRDSAIVSLLDDGRLLRVFAAHDFVSSDQVIDEEILALTLWTYLERDEGETLDLFLERFGDDLFALLMLAQSENIAAEQKAAKAEDDPSDEDEVAFDLPRDLNDLKSFPLEVRAVLSKLFLTRRERYESVVTRAEAASFAEIDEHVRDILEDLRAEERFAVVFAGDRALWRSDGFDKLAAEHLVNQAHAAIFRSTTGKEEVLARFADCFGEEFFSFIIADAFARQGISFPEDDGLISEAMDATKSREIVVALEVGGWLADVSAIMRREPLAELEYKVCAKMKHYAESEIGVHKSVRARLADFKD